MTQLESIQKMSLELLHYTGFLGKDENDLTERIYQSLRKIIICTHFSNRQIIAVTGMQGVGKTTLIKNFYGLPDSLFNISLNRSEKLPVLITESSDCTKPQLQVSKIERNDDRYDVKIVPIMDEAEFVAASSGTDQEIMYLEIIVPFKHTNNSDISFMLLPGFENRGDYWEELISFSAKCSDTALFLIDNMRIAREENHRKLAELKDRFGENLLYVITKSDKTTDKNEQAKTQLIGVTGADADRIICAGSYSTEEENNTWIESLKNAVNAYSNDPQITRNYCTHYICDEINSNIRPVILELKSLLKNDDGNMITVELENSSWLKAFDKATAKMRKRYEHFLEKNIAISRSESIKIIEDKYCDPNILQSIRRSLFGTSVKDIRKAKNLVEDAVFQGKELAASKHCFQAMYELAGDIENNNSTVKYLLDKDLDDENKLVVKKDAKPILSNAKALLSKSGEVKTLEPASVKKSIDVIVELGTCYFCSKDSAQIPRDNIPELSGTSLTGAEILNKASEAKKFGLSMLGILGFDALDGDSDIINYISTTFAASSTAATIGLAAIAIIGAGLAIAKDITRMGREDMVSCVNSVNSIYDNIKAQCIDNYDAYMDRIRDVVEDNIIANNHDQRDALNKYNAICLITKMENELSDFLDNMRGAAYGLRSAFSRA